MLTLQALPVPVEKTEEGADYPPVIDYRPGLPGRKNPTPQGSTAELFREFQHFGLRGTWSMPLNTKGPSILLPKTCEVIAQERILVDRPLAECGTSKVLLIKLRVDKQGDSSNKQLVPCVARLVREPNRQFWREIGVWSSLRHECIVRFVGICISSQGPLSVCMHYPEGSVYEDNARLRTNAQATAPLGFGLRSGWTLVNWVKQLVGAMHYLHGLKPWPVLYRNLKSSNIMLSDGHKRISLTDFAICRQLAAHDDVTPAQGSDRWLAPEALMGEQFDLACDVFSFALTCWEMTACEIPFALHSSRQAATLIVEGLRPTVPSHCPEWLAKLMAACNAHVPEARPSFDAIHAALVAPADTNANGLSQSMETLLRHSERVMLARLEKTAAATGQTLNLAVAPPQTLQQLSQHASPNVAAAHATHAPHTTRTPSRTALAAPQTRPVAPQHTAHLAGQMPPGQMAPAQMQAGQMPPGQMPPGQMQMQAAQMQASQMQASQMPPAQMPVGQVPGQMQAVQMPPGQMQMQAAQLPMTATSLAMATGFAAGGGSSSVEASSAGSRPSSSMGSNTPRPSPNHGFRG